MSVEYQNAFNPLDVNDDGFITPLDVLAIVNELNTRGSRELAIIPPLLQKWVDVSGDAFVSPQDALIVINHLNQTTQLGIARPVIAVGLAPEADPDGNGVVLRSQVVFVGQTGPQAKIRITGGLQAATMVANAEGRFHLPVELSPGINSLHIQVIDVTGQASATDRVVRVGDVVHNWNASLLNVIRDWTTVSNDPYQNRIVPERPPVAARNLAMMHIAMFDAVNSIERHFEPYRFLIEPSSSASTIAAAATAAHRVASSLYSAPDELAIFHASLMESLAFVPEGPSKQAGIELGVKVADAVLEWRRDDGAKIQVAYASKGSLGAWDRTHPDFLPPLLPQWPLVLPFAMNDGKQFRPPAPPSLNSLQYAVAVDEVMRLGSLNSAERTAEQTEIALFWADGGGTFTPPGHWNRIASDASLQQDRALGRTTSVAQNSRLFALLNIALADAGISAWDAKYAYDLWRPIDAIRKAADDSNPMTSADLNWTPLLKTPPFPAYTSGHSTFSGAADAVLSNLFGDSFRFATSSDAHDSFSQRPLADSQIIHRSYESFSAAADEAGRSRIFGGIHFEFDNQAGLKSGRSIGNLVISQLLKPRPSISNE